MNVLIVYDSNYGNTKQIAEIIAEEFNTTANAVTKLKSIKPEEYELLIIGSPINGWKPTINIYHFFEQLKTNALKGIKATSFDTRVDFFLHGDAAKKIANQLKHAGADIITEPEFFFVEKSEGPLQKGEVKKAKMWAKKIKHDYGLSESFTHSS